METLLKEGISLRDYDVGEHKTTCPQCSHSRKNKRDLCLSVRIDSDGSCMWKCHHCEWSGGASREIWRSLGTQPLNRKPPRKIREPDSLDLPENILEWFQKRHISESTVKAFGIYRSMQSFGEAPVACISFPYREGGDLVNVKYRANNKQFRQEKDAKRTLFGIDRVRTHWDGTNDRTVVFVEGEMDVLAMNECGITYATTLPDGAPQTAKFDPNDKRFEALKNCEWIQDAERVIIATDGDEPGQALAIELAHRFGKDRCWTVEWPEDVKDANECLIKHGSDRVGKLIDDAKPYPVDGLHSIDEYLNEVLNIYHGKIQKPLDTGFSNLDQIYKVMPSTFTLVTGIPNHGKSNFIDQLIMNLNRLHGWKFAIFSPEHSSSNHIRRLLEKYVKLPFDTGPSMRMTEDQVRDGFKSLSQKFHFIEHQEAVPSIDWILDKARVAILRYGVRGIVVDPYNEIDSSRDGNKREDEHIRDLISKCKAFCRKHEIVMWMVAHPAKMQRTADGSYPPPSLYDVSGSAHWNNMADVGIVVHRDFDAGTTRVITRKIREQGLYGTIGEAFFEYNLSTHCYEPQYDTRPRHWTDDD